MPQQKLTHHLFDSPIGALHLVASSKGLRSIRLLDGADLPISHDAIAHAHLVKTCKQLEAYFTGKRKSFALALDLPSTPSFARSVWDAMLHIPYGTVKSYAEVATAIGHPLAFRAVGTACGKNPLPIVIPCHRIIATSGGLGGFGLGLWRKKNLLQLEGYPSSDR